MAGRVFIAGVPRAGKTTLAKSYAGGGKVIHADDYLHLPHDEIPDHLARDVRDAGPDVVVEGTQVARLLRRYPELAKGARVVHMYDKHPDAPAWSPGQRRQAKGLHTVWRGARRGLDGAIVIHARHQSHSG